MKYSLIFIYSILSVFSKSAGAQAIRFDDRNTICFFKCSGNYQAVNNGCAMTQLADYSKVPPEINPYKIFDSLILSIRNEAGSGEFNLDYRFLACNLVCNAAATLDDKKRPVIYYNPQFIDSIRFSNSRKRWAILAIFAHEIGHQVMSHTSEFYPGLTPKRRRSNELRADFFCGFILSKIPGATVENAYEGIRTLDSLTYLPQNAAQEINNDYPTLANRYLAIKEGFLSKSDDSEKIAIFKHIKEYAANSHKPGKSIIFNFRETDKALKDGNLELVLKLVDEFMAQKNISEPELLLDKKNVEELKKQIQQEMSITPSIEKKNNKLEIIVNKTDINKISKTKSAVDF